MKGVNKSFSISYQLFLSISGSYRSFLSIALSTFAINFLFPHPTVKRESVSMQAILYLLLMRNNKLVKISAKIKILAAALIGINRS